MKLTDPIVAYTAGGNLEANLVVEWLTSNGVNAHAVEDNSFGGIYGFGAIRHLDKPQVFIERSDTERAAELLREFETKQHARKQQLADAPPISAECPECGATSDFPASHDGTVQNCPQCQAFMDVGAIDWPYDDDFGEDESES